MAEHLRQRRSGTAPSSQPATAAQADRQPHPPPGTATEGPRHPRRDKALRACLCGTPAAAVAFLLLCMALVGGPRELFECCEPIWQPALAPADPALPLPLAGLTALVTGANRGYGYAAARHLAEQGARIRSEGSTSSLWLS